MSLYHTYRPQNFAEVVGQEHVVRTLQNALASENIGHSYLFAGPRGTGKTSIARIFAKAINCLSPQRTGDTFEPCGTCASCQSIALGAALDIIEIDAASNTGVDNIRELRDKISFRPTQLAYKVYIIDEVHMLSKGAFNALLKTLEEPPDHVVFILATTEPFDIPATILSRCQRFDFRYLTIEQIEAHITQVGKQEKVQADAQVYALIAQLSRGALRDALSMLEQVISYQTGEITIAAAREILGVVDSEEINAFFNDIAGQDIQAALSRLHALAAAGQNLIQFCANALEYGRKLLLLQAGGEKMFPMLDLTPEELQRLQGQATRLDHAAMLAFEQALLEARLQARRLDNPLIPLELAVIRCWPSGTTATKQKVTTSESIPVQAVSVTTADVQMVSSKQTETPVASRTSSKKNKTLVAAEPVEVAPAESPEPEPTEIAKPASSPERHTIPFATVTQRWDEILQATKPMNHSVAAFLRGGKPLEFDPEGKLVIEFYYSFHKDQIEKRPHRTIVEDALEKVLGAKLGIVCRLGEKSAKPAEPVRPATGSGDSLIDEALKMFGGSVID